MLGENRVELTGHEGPQGDELAPACLEVLGVGAGQDQQGLFFCPAEELQQSESLGFLAAKDVVFASEA